MAFSLRRIVTGTDSKGKAVVSMDSVIDSRAGRFDTGTHVQEYWQTDSLPPRLDGPDAVAQRTTVTPKPAGSILRILHVAPGSKGDELHRTATIDYFMVMNGEVDMMLDDGKAVPLKKGDTVVMRNTKHAWRNRGDKPCMLFEILVDAKGGHGMLPPNTGN